MLIKLLYTGMNTLLTKKDRFIPNERRCKICKSKVSTEVYITTIYYCHKYIYGSNIYVNMNIVLVAGALANNMIGALQTKVGMSADAEITVALGSR